MEHPTRLPPRRHEAHEDRTGQPNVPNAPFWNCITPILARSQGTLMLSVPTRGPEPGGSRGGPLLRLTSAHALQQIPCNNPQPTVLTPMERMHPSRSNLTATRTCPRCGFGGALDDSSLCPRCLWTSSLVHDDPDPLLGPLTDSVDPGLRPVPMTGMTMPSEPVGVLSPRTQDCGV